MKTILRHPSWRTAEGRIIRPGSWLLAVTLAAILLVEVWQTSNMAALLLDLGRTRKEFAAADAQLGYLRAEYERGTTRGELAPLAPGLGLTRADAQQVRALPADYLAAEISPRDAGSVSMLTLAERLSRAVVPEARARSRAGN